MYDEYFVMLDVVYTVSPAKVLTILTDNRTFIRAGDLATKKLFPDLTDLYTGICEWREQVWWNERNKILTQLVYYDLIEKSEAERFLSS